MIDKYSHAGYKNIITNSLKEWKGQEYEKEVIWKF